MTPSDTARAMRDPVGDETARLAARGILRHAVNGLGPRALAEIRALIEEWPDKAEVAKFAADMAELADRMEGRP